MLYKYSIKAYYGRILLISYPLAFASELRPQTASIVTSIGGFVWTDEKWLASRPEKSYEQPMNIYEVHLGSWKKPEVCEFLNYREIARTLPSYVKEMG